MAQLPDGCRFHTGWVTQKIAFGEEVQAVDCYQQTGTYVVGVSSKVNFKLPEDETHTEWTSEGQYILSKYPRQITPTDPL